MLRWPAFGLATCCLLVMLVSATGCNKPSAQPEGDMHAQADPAAPDGAQESPGAVAPVVPPESTDDPSHAMATPEAAVMEGIPSKIPLPAQNTPTPDIADGAQVQYTCESGAALYIAYVGNTARVRWVERTLVLHRDPGSDDERYVGEGYRLLRIANVVQLEQAKGGQSWRCSEQASSA